MRGGIGLKAWAALAVVYVVWGSTYLAIAVVIETFPPLFAAGVRWLIAGSVMLAIGWRRLPRDQRPTLLHWRNAAVVGIALCLGGNGLVSVAEQRVASGMAALLVATIPLLVAVLDALVHKRAPGRIVVVSLLVGLVGVGVLVRPDAGGRSVDLLGAGLLLLAATSWAIGSVFAGRAALPARPLLGTGMEMVSGGLAIAVVAALTGDIGRFDPDAVSTSSLLALGYLIVMGSLLAFTCYVWLLRNIPNQVTTTYAYVNPLVAVWLGWAIRDEPITATTLVGGLLIIASVALTVSLGARREGDRSIDLTAEDIPA